MNLHHDREAFAELLIGAANELAIPTAIIEQELNRKGTNTYTCKGVSMLPLLRQQRDLFTITKRVGMLYPVRQLWKLLRMQRLLRA